MSQPASVLFDLPGPRAKRRHRLIAVVGGLGLAWLVFAFFHGMRGQLGWDKWAPFLDQTAWTSYLLPGLGQTLLAAGISIGLALLLGLVLGLGRLAHTRVVNWLASAFVEFFRAVPVLMMMIFAYYAFMVTGLAPPDRLPLAGVVVGLTLYNACVIAELIRSGVHSLPHGQREAGLAVGLRAGQTLRVVLVPQAVTAMLPSLFSQLIVVLKDTALGYFITYGELLQSATTLAAWKGNLLASFLVVAAIYVSLNYGLAWIAWLSRRRLRSRVVRPAEVVRPDLATGADPDAPLYADPSAFIEAPEDSYEGHRGHFFAPEELADRRRRDDA